MLTLFLTLFIGDSAWSSAECPSVSINGGEPHSLRLSGSQAHCAPAAIFTCEKGSLRISGVAKSVDTGAQQITVYCQGAGERPGVLGYSDTPQEEPVVEEENPTN